VIDFLEFYLQALIALIGGTLLSAAVGTGVVLCACFIIADYINAKMTVKELQTELHDCQRRLYDIEHPAAAGRFRDQEPET
jgi:hypothetical protein